jgi:mannose-6-phosphate isomerase
MLYPLRFEPLFRRYIWGGQRLKSVLQKPIGDEDAAESWEIVDHGDDQSVVKFGDLAGQSLRELIQTHGDSLLGVEVAKQVASDRVPEYLQNRFPLLLKFLDANRALSIQVHPDDTFGATLDPPDLGKTEAWYVLAAEPGAQIFAGLKSGVDRSQFEAAVADAKTEDVMHSFEPAVGDCVFIPAGTMHAIGQGLMIAEIQQASDTTFRVYDWGRVGDDGKSRPLHIEQSVAATDFARGPVEPTVAKDVAANVQELVNCDKFVMRRHRISEATTIGGDGKFRILAVTEGALEVQDDPSGLPLALGQTMLLPASLPVLDLTPKGAVELLEIFVP